MRLSTYQVTQDWIDRAWVTANDVGELKRSMRGKKANFIGALGEIAFEEFLNDNLIWWKDDRRNTRNDYVIYGKATVEVKTRDRTVEPKPDYECGVMGYNHDHQQADYFAFMSTQREKGSETPHLVHFLGACNLAQLKRYGRWMEKGYVDKSNNMEFKEDGVNMYIHQLTNPWDVAKAWYKRYSGGYEHYDGSKGLFG
jgi:hypothetical protein